MALQTSGAISLSQVQSEFGGSNPISMSEYYRGGAFVPSTLAGAWSAWQGSLNTPVYYWSILSGGSTSVYWNGSFIGEPSQSATTFSSGGYDYERGSLFDSFSDKYQTYYFYQVRRRTQSETVNTSIPTSGQISMSNFYGGRKT